MTSFSRVLIIVTITILQLQTCFFVFDSNLLYLLFFICVVIAALFFFVSYYSEYHAENLVTESNNMYLSSCSTLYSYITRLLAHSYILDVLEILSFLYKSVKASLKNCTHASRTDRSYEATYISVVSALFYKKYRNLPRTLIEKYSSVSTDLDNLKSLLIERSSKILLHHKTQTSTSMKLKKIFFFSSLYTSSKPVVLSTRISTLANIKYFSKMNKSKEYSSKNVVQPSLKKKKITSPISKEEATRRTLAALARYKKKKHRR